MTHKTLSTALGFALAATLSASPSLFAQAPQQSAPDAQTAPVQTEPSATPVHTPDPHRQAMRIAKQLNLTSDQTAKLEPILAERDQKITALRADASLTPRDAHKQMHVIQQSMLSQLGSVLTADQLMQLKSLQHAHAHPGQGQTPPAAAPAA